MKVNVFIFLASQKKYKLTFTNYKVKLKMLGISDNFYYFQSVFLDFVKFD